MTLVSEGKLAEAEAEYRAVLAIKERVLGPADYGIQITRTDLADLLEAQGNHAEAETELRAVLSACERDLGPEAPQTASACYRLAICLKCRAKTAEALKFARRYLDICSGSLPAHDHWARQARELVQELEQAQL